MGTSIQRPPAAGQVAMERSVDVVLVRVGSRDYAIPAASVLEVLQMVAITPIDGVPTHVAGVVNLRGRVVTVVDLRRLYGAPHEVGLSTPLVVVANGDDVGMMVVDGVAGMAQATAAGNAGLEAIQIDGRICQIVDVASIMPVRELTAA